MALIKCPECGKEVSDRSEICVGCGFPIKEYLFEKSKNEELQESIVEKEKLLEIEQFEIFFSNGFFIKLNRGIVSVKFYDREFEDEIDNFVLLHCNIDEEKNNCIFSFIDKNKAFFSGVIATEMDPDGIAGFKKFRHIMCNHKLYANRKYNDEVDRPLSDVKDIPMQEKFLKRGKPFTPSYSTKPSKELQAYIDDFHRNYISLNENDIVKRDKPIENKEIKEKEPFHGIYRYILGEKREIYCPVCRSQNCHYFTSEKFIPGERKTSYKANLNPFKPFTFAKKKERVIKESKTVLEKKIMCDDCGNIFD